MSAEPEVAAPTRRARRITAVVLSGLAVAAAGGWYAGTLVRSPADAAASHRAPTASRITVPVEQRRIVSTVVAHGTVAYAAARPVVLAGAVGGPSAGVAAGAVAQRVTRPPTAGAQVVEGAVLCEVSGRPVFVLSGTVPMYRTITPGTQGDDVRQLQSALERLGFDPGAQDGVFGTSTGEAVTRWYRARGYAAQQPTAADRQQRAQLQQAVRTAQENLLQLQLQSGGGASGQLAAMHLADARTAVTDAQNALDAFDATYGVSVPAGEIVFLPRLPARVDRVDVQAGDTPSGAVATVTGSSLVVQGSLPGTDAALLRVGMPTVLGTVDGRQVQGTVGALGPDAQPADGSSSGGTGGAQTPAGGAGGPGGSGDGAGTGPVALRIDVTDTGVLGAYTGAAVTITVQVAATGGDVLAVPLAAVVTGADGQARVTAVRSDGREEQVPVALGLAAGGYVQITPQAGARLAAGDRVTAGVAS